MSDRFTVTPRRLEQLSTRPVASRLDEDGTLFVDFGRAGFGSLLIPGAGLPAGHRLVVHLGEQLAANTRSPAVNRKPGGSIRYLRIEQCIDAGKDYTRLVIPRDDRNTGPASIRMPSWTGEVTVFRYVEIENAGAVDAAALRQLLVRYPFDRSASMFTSSSSTLDAVWELCKYSIEATTFCGMYVDGDRERVPYEADAYINQLSHYGVDSEYALARYTHEYLIQHPTWPTEWQMHSVMMAWADHLYTGDTLSLRTFYHDLRVKTLIGLARADGLVSTSSESCNRAFETSLHLHGDTYIFEHGLRDLVDWPPGSFTDGGTGERDDHEMCPVNTVVNAFHCHATRLMARIAAALGNTDDEQLFSAQADQVAASINDKLFDAEQGIYVDGEGSTHASLHSNMFMLAFDLVPPERRNTVLAYVTSRGMACSVYGAQFLLEALYLNDAGQNALDLLTARHDRSWWNMLACGSTITLEAWDHRYKNNLDWNHAWGAAPANLVPRYLLGVRPLQPGFRTFLIQPQPGNLEHVSGVVPTIRGPVGVHLGRERSGERTLRVDIPAGTEAVVKIGHCACANVVLNDQNSTGQWEGSWLVFDGMPPGQHRISYRVGAQPLVKNGQSA